MIYQNIWFMTDRTVLTKHKT